MSKSAMVSFRVTAEQKAMINSVCSQKGITESAFVRQLMEMAVETAGSIPAPAPQSTERVRRCCRVSFRLRPDDGLLVWECAGKHRVSMSAYVARIVRDHMRAGLPLPNEEVEALRVSIDEVNAIGQALNEIARAVNRGEQVAGPNRSDLKKLLDALGRLRDRFRAVISANASSWRL